MSWLIDALHNLVPISFISFLVGFQLPELRDLKHTNLQFYDSNLQFYKSTSL